MPISSLEKKTTRIRILPEELANQIAAGEVVERPASVVKELVENSIDARSTRILIDIESGGKGMVRVTDNGVGMPKEDAEKAFARHATSKITSSGDLEVIRTLGFRGEALPSIASVARVRLMTASDENQGGTQVAVEGGGAPSVKDYSRPRGTTVEVAQIFFNTPARKKFLKGDTTEFSHITQVVTQQALANPRIHFTLTHNGREIINTLPTEQLLYRIAELFGAELAKELVPVHMENEDYHLEGYLSSPVFTRSSRSAQYCFINHRFIRDRVILHATQQGYSHLLPRGKHPVIFLFLSMDPKLFDVNVHPSKAEVRFAFQQEVHRLVSAGVRKALSGDGGAPEVQLETVPGGADIPISPAPSPSQKVPESPKGTRDDSCQAPGTYSPEQRHRLANALERMYQSHTGASSSREVHLEQRPLIFDHKPIPVSNLIYSEFEPLGQVDRSFIILQGKRGILLVDQHVAHERILYERFRNAAKNRKIEIQKLLFPQSVELTPAEAELLTPQLEKLKELGLELEPFGPSEFLLRSVPAILKNNDHARIVKEIVELLPRQEDPAVLRERYEDILIMMSCRNAIKVNHSLDMDQIRKLIFDLEQTEMPFTCPHGRPIALFFDIEDILKKFLRK